jgi:hypothetical protein
MPHLDVFNGNAFSLLSLTAAVNKTLYVPGRIERMALFNSRGVATTDIDIEERRGTLALVPTTPRGAPGTGNVRDRRKLRKLSIPRLLVPDSVYASEVQNVRAFGTESETQTVMGVLNEKVDRARNNIDATKEYHRVGAIKGVIYDSDGTSLIYNLYTEFEVTQTVIDFELDNANTEVLLKCMQTRRAINDALGAVPMTGIYAFCGTNFFDSLVAHSKVKTAYQYFQQSGQMNNPLRQDLGYVGFTFGGITFEEYRGTVGGVDFIPDNDAYAFPLGVPNLFETVYAPADYEETVNQIGLPLYVKTAPDPSGFDRFRQVEISTYPLSYCTRPESCIRLTI